jgi:hypothetical protein
MSGDFKPGDVAMVMCNDGVRRIALYCTHIQRPFWRFTTGGMRDVEISDARRLVVIDPEDAEQVERLAQVYDETFERLNPGTYSYAPTLGEDADNALMQAALRKFADPKPRIEEPTGLGAVVEDADGRLWISNYTSGSTRWRSDRRVNNFVGWRAWADIKAVTILSPGVPQ